MAWKYRHTVLVLCTFAFFSTMVSRLVISPVIPHISAAFSISNSMIGLALTGMWMAYALAQYPSGFLAKRMGDRAVILVALGGTAVSSLLLASSPHFTFFFIAAILLGVVAGLHYSVATILLSRYYRDIGTAIGIHNFGAPAAGVLAPILAAWVGVRFGWRFAVVLGTAVALPIFFTFLKGVRPVSTEYEVKGGDFREDIRFGLLLVARPPVAFTLIIAMTVSFVLQATITFLPTFLIHHRGHSTTLAGLVFSSFFIANGVLQVGVGAVSDRFGRDRVLAICMATGAAGFLIFIALPGALALGVAILLLGIGLGAPTAILPRFFDYLSEDERATGFGMVRTIYMLGASLGSVTVGALADFFDWGVAFFLPMVLLLIILGAIVINHIFGGKY